MKIKTEVTTNLKMDKVSETVAKATSDALKDVVVAIASDVIKIHPWKTITGNNSRSIMYEIRELEGKVYSTSGYGGYLETGTATMPAFPYFKPALDKNIGKLPAGIKAHLK